ncbi:hypothetical protein Bca101_014627 [Brassica carinata]
MTTLLLSFPISIIGENNTKIITKGGREAQTNNNNNRPRPANLKYSREAQL